VLGRRHEQAEAVVRDIAAAGGEGLAISADVLDRSRLEGARNTLLERWRRIDILVNAAGGNVPQATVGTDTSFFDLPIEGLRQVIDLNLLGTILPSQVFGATMVQRSPDDQAGQEGCIVNISSLSAQRALTRVVGYGAAKAGIEQFTRWLAVEMARTYGSGLRVNAIAPGFFLAEQNRALLLDPDGTPTERGRAILDHTPMGRFGAPDDLISTLIWLCSPGARFVTGAVVPVDGGFGAFSGV
jgi:NAD(P)-dependent dehydrogenase (short-subunit alcohol dehydrogenase family)